MKRLFEFIGYLVSFLSPLRLRQAVAGMHKYFYTGFYRRFFASFGDGSVINPQFLMLVGADRIKVGAGVYIGCRVQLTAWSRIGEQTFSPEIVIGDGSSIGDESQLTAIEGIHIGRGVLTGKKVLISDNSHGDCVSHPEEAAMRPLDRPMYSRGPVTIGDNVWIGEKATVVGGVTIGEGAVIGANSVVTHDIPAFAVAAGCPAKVVKMIR